MSWTVIQQSLPNFIQGFKLTLWLSLVGIIGAIIVGIIASLVQYFRVSAASLISTWKWLGTRPCLSSYFSYTTLFRCSVGRCPLKPAASSV